MLAGAGVIYSAGMQGQRVRTCERDIAEGKGELRALREAHTGLCTKADLDAAKKDLKDSIAQLERHFFDTSPSRPRGS